MSNFLDGTKCYLIGGIDRISDESAIGWRKYVKDQCKDTGIEFLDPTNKPVGIGIEIAKEKNTAETLRKNKDWDGLAQFVKRFRHADLRFCDLSDFVVIYIDTSTHMCGSYDELFTIERQQKPILAIVEGGLDAMPTWLFAFIDINNVFKNTESCVEYIHSVNNNKETLNKKWVLINGKN